MRPVELAPGLFWTGVLDPQLRVFDVIIRADSGTSYNSYLVRGERGCAVIEAVKAPFLPAFLDNLRELTTPERLLYVVVNHTEPDHSGALKALLAWAPGAQVVCSRNAVPFVQGILGPDAPEQGRIRMVGEADSLDLGGVTLRFIEAPFLHWPDSMFTWCPERKALFPCDFFGSHYCDDRLWDDLAGDFAAEQRSYFDHILRPFKEHARKALDKVEKLPLAMVCPSHGPVLRTSLPDLLARYRAWSLPPARGDKPSVVVAYASSYGNTARMAEEVAAGAREAGAEARVFDITAASPGELLDAIEGADALAVGSLTINGDAVKPAWDLLSSLATVKVKGKAAAAFGCYAWSGEAVKNLSERLRMLRFKIAGEGVRARLVPTAEDLAACRALGAALASSRAPA